MSKVTVYKLDENGFEIWRYEAVVIHRGVSSVRLEAFFDREDVDLGYVILKQGDRFVETFYSDRWYNVFAVYDRGSQRLKGWYCNICRPAELGESEISAQDLALDIWNAPPDHIQILDEEEFNALDLSAEERGNCLLALKEVQRLAKSHLLPF